jgi:hypothetical protein
VLETKLTLVTPAAVVLSVMADVVQLLLRPSDGPAIPAAESVCIKSIYSKIARISQYYSRIRSALTVDVLYIGPVETVPSLRVYHQFVSCSSCKLKKGCTKHNRL